MHNVNKWPNILYKFCSLHGTRFSHIFKTPSISNEKLTISNEKRSISIVNLGFSRKVSNIRLFAHGNIWYFENIRLKSR